jgi:hypothetical protein
MNQTDADKVAASLRSIADDPAVQAATGKDADGIKALASEFDRP